MKILVIPPRPPAEQIQFKSTKEVKLERKIKQLEVELKKITQERDDAIKKWKQHRFEEGRKNLGNLKALEELSPKGLHKRRKMLAENIRQIAVQGLLSL